jgi:hypothetical protein
MMHNPKDALAINLIIWINEKITGRHLLPLILLAKTQ